MNTTVSRMQLLRGNFTGGKDVLRPPWAVDEESFLDGCTRCDVCRDHCPTNIIVAGSGGFPIVDFSNGECTFCGDCGNYCEPGVLSSSARASGDPPWTYLARFTRACLNRLGILCRSCGDHCIAGAIRFRPVLGGALMPTVASDRCTGCGACHAPCPVGAIEIGRF